MYLIRVPNPIREPLTQLASQKGEPMKLHKGERSRFQCWLTGLTLGAAGIGLCGCGTLTSKQFDVSKAEVGKELDGVPFSLNRPKITVVRTPGADGAPDTFSLPTAYEPDPENQYVLKMDPGFFSSVDWTMNFDVNGVLVETNAKTTDQTASLISAAGSLASAAVGIPRSLRIFEGPATCENTESPEIGKIRDDMLGTKESPGHSAKLGQLPDKKMLWDARNRKEVSIPPQEVESYVSSFGAMWADVSALKCHGQLAKFAYKNSQELQLLQTALHLEETSNPPASSRVVASWLVLKKTPDGADKKIPDDVLQCAFRIEAALRKYDFNELDAIKTELLKTAKNLNSKLAANLDADVAPGITNNNICMEMIADAQSVAEENAAIKLLRQLAELTPTEWRNRRISALNQEISQLQQQNRVPNALANSEKNAGAMNDDERSDPNLKNKSREKARILGVLSEYDRRQELEEIGISHGDIWQSQSLLAEIDYLDKQIAAAEAPTVIAKSPEKADDPAAAAYIVSSCPGGPITGDAIQIKVDDSGTIKAKLASQPGKTSWKDTLYRPEYVVVFQPPSDTTECKGKP